jgi:hypothetical protein
MAEDKDLGPQATSSPKSKAHRTRPEFPFAIFGCQRPSERFAKCSGRKHAGSVRSQSVSC